MATQADLFVSNSMPNPKITRDELRARLADARLAIVNVMPKETFRDGHIPNSINLPIAEIDRCARQVLPDFAQEIAVYCAGPT